MTYSTHIYEPKDFSSLTNSVKGISENAMKNHFKLYEGYVNKTNEINTALIGCDKSKANHNYSEYRSLLVDKSHNLNGVVLHELFFSNLATSPIKPDDRLINHISNDYPDWDTYIADLKATCKASRAGWALSVYNYRDGKISNFAIDQHNLLVPAFTVPLVIIDLWEHAYTTDFGIDKPKYIDTIVENINWDIVLRRLENIST